MSRGDGRRRGRRRFSGGAPRPTRSGAVLLATVAVVGAAACGGKRERLDVPQIALEVGDQAAAPGGRITGRVSATDASGLTLLSVYACTADSLFRQGFDLDRVHAAAFDFSLHVASTATPGEEVEVYAVAGDDQGFYADTARALTVGGVAPTDTARAICPRVIHARRVPGESSPVPTAP